MSELTVVSLRFCHRFIWHGLCQTVQRAARAPGLKTAIVIRPVITQPVTGMAETALVRMCWDLSIFSPLILGTPATDMLGSRDPWSGSPCGPIGSWDPLLKALLWCRHRPWKSLLLLLKASRILLIMWTQGPFSPALQESKAVTFSGKLQ